MSGNQLQLNGRILQLQVFPMILNDRTLVKNPFLIYFDKVDQTYKNRLFM